MKKFWIVLSLLASFSATAQTPAPAAAPPTFIVADGSSSGTYKAMFKQMTSFCNADTTGLAVSELESHGAVENLAKLIDNEANGAFLHSDVIFYRNQSEKLEQRVQTLLALYPEEVHVLALRNSKAQTEGKFGGFGKKPIDFDFLGDLKGRHVGAAGGGVITATVINNKADLNLSVDEFANGDEALAALNSGAVDAVFYVGGAPLPNIAKLDGGQYKLLAINDSLLPRLQDVYKTARITYTKLSKDQITTVAADALFVTKNYKTPKMVAALAKFRECFYAHLEEMKETTGLHPKWQLVDPANQGKWTWFELPTDAPSSAGTEAKQAPAAKKKTKK